VVEHGARGRRERGGKSCIETSFCRPRGAALITRAWGRDERPTPRRSRAREACTGA
jgi:hypothetical protein